MTNDQREARIIDLDSEDGEVGPGVLSMPGPSPAQLLMGLVVVAAAVALAFGPLGVVHGPAGRSPAPSPVGVTVPPLESFGPVPTDGQVALDGWPVTFDPQYDQSVSVGPDGTVYLGHLAGLDATGHPRAGWLTLADGTHARPCAFGSDGTIYGDTIKDNGTHNIWIFGSDDKLRFSSAVEVLDYSQVVPGPGGSVYFVIPSPGDPAGSTIQIVAPNGSGATIVTPGMVNDAAVGGDGTIYLTILTIVNEPQVFVGYSLRILSPNGEQVAKDSEPVWWGMALAPDGTLYAWGYDRASSDDPVADQSRIAAFDSDGRLKPGWPITFRGGISAPRFGPDGTVYLISDYSSVVALGPDGRSRAGWPVSLPAGETVMSGTDGPAAPAMAQAPIVDDTGRVYVTTTDLHDQGMVVAFDASGAASPGWALPLDASPVSFVVAPDSSAGSVFVRLPSGQGRIYIALADKIEAVDENGNPVPGWPLSSPGVNFAVWQGMWATQDGGLIVEVATAPSSIGGGPENRLYRLPPDGQLVK